MVHLQCIGHLQIIDHLQSRLFLGARAPSLQQKMCSQVTERQNELILSHLAVREHQVLFLNPFELDWDLVLKEIVMDR